MNAASKMLKESLKRAAKHAADTEGAPGLPKLTRHVMESLSKGDEADAVWKELGTDEKTVGDVINRVRTALECAQNEAHRPTASDENDDHTRIVNLATTLKREIKAAMPGGSCRPFEHRLKANDLPALELGMGWHSLGSKGQAFGYQLAVADVLDWVITEAKQRSESLPTRAVLRRRGDPEISAFVRHLAWQFKRAFGLEMHGTIGHIANAIFEPKDKPLDAHNVQGILKDRPPQFETPT